MIPSSEFKPWRRDYVWGCVTLAVGLATSWTVLLLGHPYIGVVVAVWLTHRGCRRVAIGARRERGVAVELAAVARMRTVLEPKGYGIRADLAAMWLGNIDSVVSPPWTEASFVVEIKSFTGIIRRFYGLTKVNKYYRLRQPIRQVWKQCRYLNKKWHFPVLWMPASKLQTCFLYRGVLIVNGDVDLLDRALLEFDKGIHLPAAIAFDGRPPLEYRMYAKRLGFVYDRNALKWYGRLNKKQAAEIGPRIAPVNGQILWLRRR